MKRILIYTASLIFAAVILYSHNASAITNVMPDPADNDVTMYLTVVRNKSVEIPKVTVKAYFTNNGKHTITIENADLCANNGNGDYDFNLQYTTSTRFTQYKAFKTVLDRPNLNEVQSTQLDSVWGNVNQNRNSPCASRTLTIPAGSLVKSPWNGFYTAILTADIIPGGQENRGNNVFRFRSEAGSYIGMVGKATTANAKDVGYELIGQDDQYSSRFDVPLAPDCTVRNTAWRPITIYDPDNGETGVQPQKFFFRVYDETAGSYLTGASYRNPRSITGGASGWYPLNLSDDDTSIEVNWQVGHRYKIRFQHVWDDNTLQIGTPFDSIYYINQCSPVTLTPNVNGTIDGTPENDGETAIVGQNVGFTFDIKKDNPNIEGSTEYKVDVTDGHGNRLGGTGPTTIIISKPTSDYNIPYSFSGIATTAWGNKICATLTITPADLITGVDQRTDQVCYVVGKFPTLQVTKGDIRTGGAFATASGVCQVKATNAYVADGGADTLAYFGIYGHNYGNKAKGSFSQYGVLSVGRDYWFGTNGNTTNAPTTEYDSLAFANSRYTPPNPARDGYFYSTAGASTPNGTPIDTHCIPNPFTLYDSASATPTGDRTIAATGNGIEKYTFSGSNKTLTINGGNLSAGQRHIIRIQQSGAATGNKVVVAGDINYAGSWGLQNGPQFILLADTGIDVLVNNGVKQLSGIYATKGSFVTCGDYTADGFRGNSYNLSGDDTKLSLTQCTNQLTVNGMVMTGTRVYPYRTAGQGTPADTAPAEVFSLRPDVLLSEYGAGTQQGAVTTIHQNELPPRF